MAGIGRDDDERNTKPEAHGVDLGRIDMVVPASPVVPGDEDRSRVQKGLAPMALVIEATQSGPSAVKRGLAWSE